MNLLLRKDIMVFILIVILALLIGYNILYKNYQDRIVDIKAQIEEEKKKNDILGVIGLLDKKLQRYYERSFPATETTKLVDTVSALAAKVNLSIETFDPLPTEYREEHAEVPLRLPLRCNYHQLGKFLSLIESNYELIRIRKMVMKKPVIELKKKTTPKIELTVSGIYLKE